MTKQRLATLAIILTLTACGSDTPAKIDVRVAHLSPDAPAVDFCLKKGTGSFTGPVLKGLGVTAGAAYGQVTRYLELDAGQYAARLVAPNAADCTTSLAGLPDYTLPDLSGKTFATVAAIGRVADLAGGGATAFTLKPFVDESTVATGKAALRFVHASPGTPAVDVGVGSGTAFTPVYTNVAFAGTASNTGIDALGYLVTAPLADVTLSARATGTTADALVIPGANLPAGAVATAFAVGVLGNATTPLKVLLCVDSAAAVGALSACSLVP